MQPISSPVRVFDVPDRFLENISASLAAQTRIMPPLSARIHTLLHPSGEFVGQKKEEQEDAPLAWLPLELLSDIMTHLPYEDQARLASTSRSFSIAALQSCKKNELSLFHSFVETFLHTLQEKEHDHPQDYNEAITFFQKLTAEIEEQVSLAQFVPTVRRVQEAARNAIAKWMAGKDFSYIACTLAHARKPVSFTSLPLLSKAYTRLNQLISHPREEAIDPREFQTLLCDFLEGDDTNTALKLASHCDAINMVPDPSLLLNLLDQCLAKGSAHKMLIFIFRLPPSALREALLNTFECRLNKSPCLTQQVLSKLDQTQSSCVNLELKTLWYMVRIQLFYLLGQHERAFLGIKNIHAQSSSIPPLLEIMKHPAFLQKQDRLIQQLVQVFLRIDNFKQALEAAHLLSDQAKLTTFQVIFQKALASDRVEFIPPLIESFPEDMKPMLKGQLFDHELALGRIKNAIEVLNPSLAQAWSHTKLTELAKQFAESEEWVQYIQIVELIPSLPHQIECLLPVCANLTSGEMPIADQEVFQKRQEIFLILIQNSKMPVVRDYLLYAAHALALANHHLDFSSQLIQLASQLYTKWTLQANHIQLLYSEGRSQEAYEAILREETGFFKAPLLFSLMDCILDSTDLSVDYQLDSLIRISSHFSMSDVLQAIGDMQRSIYAIPDVSRQMCGEFIQKLDQLLTLIEKGEGKTQKTTQGRQLLEQASAIVDQLPDIPEEE